MLTCWRDRYNKYTEISAFISHFLECMLSNFSVGSHIQLMPLTSAETSNLVKVQLVSNSWHLQVTCNTGLTDLKCASVRTACAHL